MNVHLYPQISTIVCSGSARPTLICAITGLSIICLVVSSASILAMISPSMRAFALIPSVSASRCRWQSRRRRHGVSTFGWRGGATGAQSGARSKLVAGMVGRSGVVSCRSAWRRYRSGRSFIEIPFIDDSNASPTTPHDAPNQTANPSRLPCER